MKQEEKELLLVDLCGRLPYGVKMNHIADTEVAPVTLIGIAKDMITLKSSAGYSSVDVEDYKPYLFPLSSMTEEQEEEFNNLFYRCHESAFIFNERFSYDRCSIKDIGFYPCYLQDWFNKNHFDYRGLIPMGLAIDATRLNIY